jgi:hypothetical protein
MKRLIAVLMIAAAGCAASGQAEHEPDPAAETAKPPSATAQQQEGLLVPAGFGTLRQDEFTVSLRSEALLVKVTPLGESVTRLAAPDTYNRLHALAESKRGEVAALGRDAELFLVSFFSYQPDVSFTPEDVQLSHQGRLIRPLKIISLTPGWGRQRLGQQETQSAIYAFEGPFDFQQQLTVSYGVLANDDWARIATKLEVERGKARSRAGS